MELKNIEQLKDVAIAVKTPILVRTPASEYHIPVDDCTLQPLTITPREKFTYNYNNGVTVFVDDSYMYVIPSMRIVYNLLAEHGYKQNWNLFVPFSNRDYPVFEKAKWDNLLQFQKEQQAIDFVNDCADYCDKHGIGAIPDELLSKCFEMPKTGVPVKHFYYEDVYYPVLTSDFLDSMAAEKLGKYTTNNGKLVFVYRNGKTYVTNRYELLNTLRAAGYTEGSLFVPFSNGETIAHLQLGARWFECTR